MPFGSAFSRIKSFVNGGTLLPADLNSIQDDYGNELNAAEIRAGLTGGSVVRRGKTNIATSEARTNTVYGSLTTPDQISNVVLPTDGLICMVYQALWHSSVSSAGRAAIFIGANQVQIRPDGNTAAPVVQEAISVGDGGEFAGLFSYEGGLQKSGVGGGVNATSDVTTGQITGGSAVQGSDTDVLGGPCYMFAAAGTYNVSIQFRATSGTVTVKERKLWVWTMGF